jgi:N-acetylmuramic acid 6-phosphate etherase
MTAESKWQRLPTEQINPRTQRIDTLPLSAVVDVMTADTDNAMRAVRLAAPQLVRAASLVAEALGAGGRLIFVGAGTSGRLGVLEAAEMPPTFGISRHQVLAIMAGGPEAVHRAKEGVEDDEEEGVRTAAKLKPARGDVVVGISASGVTPFVRGALRRARRSGSSIIGVTCDPRSDMRKLADVLVVLRVGPEVIAGSTRLKAGTATKIALNTLTTSAMIRIGKTYGNLMVDVQSNSAKLRDRSRRILCTVTDVTPAAANALLRRTRGNLKAAIVIGKTGVSLARALELLQRSNGSVRAAIGEA